MAAVQGAENLMRKLNKIGDVSPIVMQAMKRETQRVQRTAVMLCPVNHGELRQSIKTKVEQTETKQLKEKEEIEVKHPLRQAYTSPQVWQMIIMNFCVLIFCFTCYNTYRTFGQINLIFVLCINCIIHLL